MQSWWRSPVSGVRMANPSVPSCRDKQQAFFTWCGNFQSDFWGLEAVEGSAFPRVSKKRVRVICRLLCATYLGTCAPFFTPPVYLVCDSIVNFKAFQEFSCGFVVHCWCSSCVFCGSDTTSQSFLLWKVFSSIHQGKKIHVPSRKKYR